jgi:dihydrofolate reductase
MAKLIYAMIASLDGYVADAAGRFDWSMPDDEVHAWINDLERSIGTYLYGRRLYEVMASWETMGRQPDEPPAHRDFAEIWRSADKIVFSKTLEAVTSARTRIERSFDPAAIRQLKAHASRDLSVGGPTLAGEALRAGLVDEIHLFVVPTLVGGGLAVFPSGVRLKLELLAEHRFASGFVHLHYRLH